MTIDDLSRRIHDATAIGKYETVRASYVSDLGYPTRIVFRPIRSHLPPSNGARDVP